MPVGKGDDLYIELLRYGKQHLVDGVDIEETREYLSALDPEAQLVESLDGFHNVFVEAFSEIAVADTGQRYALRMEGYFNLLEHDELQLARQSSSRAMRWALAAITLSLVSFVASMLLQVPQYCSAHGAGTISLLQEVVC